MSVCEETEIYNKEITDKIEFWQPDSEVDKEPINVLSSILGDGMFSLKKKRVFFSQILGAERASVCKHKIGKEFNLHTSIARVPHA